MSRPAAKLRTPKIINKPVSAPQDDEDARNSAEAAEITEKVESVKKADKINQVALLADGKYSIDQSLTQTFGMVAIDHYNGDVPSMPKWMFKRVYFALRVIVDTFRTEAEYNRADVEERRALAKKLGWNYAALGPNHSREPHMDAILRQKYPSMVEQLGQE